MEIIRVIFSFKLVKIISAAPDGGLAKLMFAVLLGFLSVYMRYVCICSSVTFERSTYLQTKEFGYVETTFL